MNYTYRHTSTDIDTSKHFGELSTMTYPTITKSLFLNELGSHDLTTI